METPLGINQNLDPDDALARAFYAFDLLRLGRMTANEAWEQQAEQTVLLPREGGQRHLPPSLPLIP